jgi:diadenosine tetraphosphate (Ap4A) HIT family hydrolase
LAGLLASAGIQKAPGMLPLVVRETGGCITIEHPFPVYENHFVVFPKLDVKDIADISAEDGPVILECFEHIRWLVKQMNLSRYRVETNGPELQHVTYLHFHVVSGERLR